ncbi:MULTISPECIES: asparaginase domain-containing protein [Rhizobium]|uniref:Asparaginase domain-containing protein n=1 Tax=Rhizobium rhododendri TaxID=2506430 RepID=A0ABY8ISX8_9HYPH|nr:MULTISPECIES: asparaginase domain-containing protein [Rhizobium]MBO9101693.1 asparaginase [Rhizobium sp. L58/93]MBO9187749.1 asparaginase [Rhizobium sp. E27B/91]QXZ86362.1 asparaginase [Rhizobium sp. K1/93]QXZ92183.1 asparaginase [Rhizobium sp. K15/93]TQX85227.1 asparaginase [Rhizobium sp. rho-13.1]
MSKIRIAHLAGPTATIQNTPPLVTSNKARLRKGLAPITAGNGNAAAFDPLRAQRLAAPVKVYVEQFSAHPLEADTAELYDEPDGYVGTDGSFNKARRADSDKPVYEIELTPEDGLYPLPYMAMQKDGSPWEEEATYLNSPKARQGFFPDGSRSFEEIDRLSIGADGKVNLIGGRADVDFYRVAPPGGFTKGLDPAERADIGEGAISAERMGWDFFAYKPYNLAKSPPRPMLAKITNDVQAVMASGIYDGAIWTQGSPQVEETAYWFNLLIDTKLPIACNAAQRPQGQISNDGPANIVDSVTYIESGIWSDGNGGNRCGTVVIQEQQFFAAREVAKVDARPGGYIATGGHGGILGQITHAGAPYVMYVPAYKHTAESDVNITRLPAAVKGTRLSGDVVETVDVRVKDEGGQLLADAIPSVSIVKDGGYAAEMFGDDPAPEADLDFLIRHKLSGGRLAGFVVEGLVPYGQATSELRTMMLRKASFCGLPVVRVGRGYPEGFADPQAFSLAGMNLTSTKARLLLMACLMRFGSLPAASDPANPTDDEIKALKTALAAYQAVFNTH